MGQAAATATRKATQQGVAVVSNSVARQAVAPSTSAAVGAAAADAARPAAVPATPSTTYASPPPSGPELHDKSEEHVTSVLSLGDNVEIQEPTELTAAQKEFQLFEKMQSVPIHPATPKDYVQNLLPAPKAAIVAVVEDHDAETGLVTLAPDALAEARAGAGLEPTAVGEDGIVVHGRRPSEGSATDQLILQRNLLNNVLTAEEVMELFDRHDADPAANSVAALADLYGVEPDYVAALLRYCRPPVLVSVDTDVYGVYEVRPLP